MTSTEHSVEAERRLRERAVARAQVHATLAVAAALRETAPPPSAQVRPPRRIRVLAAPLVSKASRLEQLCAAVAGTDAWALLRVLCAAETPLVTADLQAAAGIDPRRFGGLLAGFARTCACYSLTTAEVVTKTEERDPDGRLSRWYALTADARPVVRAMLLRIEPDETRERQARGRFAREEAADGAAVAVEEDAALVTARPVRGAREAL